MFEGQSLHAIEFSNDAAREQGSLGDRLKQLKRLQPAGAQRLFRVSGALHDTQYKQASSVLEGACAMAAENEGIGPRPDEKVRQWLNWGSLLAQRGRQSGVMRFK